MSNPVKYLLGACFVLGGYAAMAWAFGFIGSAAFPDHRFQEALPMITGILLFAAAAYYLTDIRFTFGNVTALLFVGFLALAVSILTRLDILANVWIIISGLCLAFFLSLLIREVNLLYPVALVAAIVDAWSVYKGPTSVMLDNEVLANSMMIAVPGMGELSSLSLFGFGDVFFFSFFLIVMRKLGLFTKARYLLLTAAFVVAGITAVLTGQNIPGIPFMSLAVLGTLGGELRLSRSERRYLLYLSGLILFLTAIGCSFIFLGKW